VALGHIVFNFRIQDKLWIQIFIFKLKWHFWKHKIRKTVGKYNQENCHLQQISWNNILYATIKFSVTRKNYKNVFLSCIFKNYFYFESKKLIISVSIGFETISSLFEIYALIWAWLTFFLFTLRTKEKFKFFEFFKICHNSVSIEFWVVPWKFCFYAYKGGLTILCILSFRANRKKKIHFSWSMKNTQSATNWEHKIKYFILFFKNEAQNFIIQVGILIPTYNWNQKL